MTLTVYTIEEVSEQLRISKRTASELVRKYELGRRAGRRISC